MDEVVGDRVGVLLARNLLCFGVRGCIDYAEVITQAMPVELGVEFFRDLERHGWLEKRLSREVKVARMRERSCGGCPRVRAQAF